MERVNLWRRMPVEQYVVDFQRSVRRVDPLQPIMGTVCAVGAVVFAINSQGRSATLAWIAVALIAVIMVASFVIAEPMNFRVSLTARGPGPRGRSGDAHQVAPLPLCAVRCGAGRAGVPRRSNHYRRSVIQEFRHRLIPQFKRVTTASANLPRLYAAKPRRKP